MSDSGFRPDPKNTKLPVVTRPGESLARGVGVAITLAKGAHFAGSSRSDSEFFHLEHTSALALLQSHHHDLQKSAWVLGKQTHDALGITPPDAKTLVNVDHLVYFT
jgi:hypothetical protein